MQIIKERFRTSGWTTALDSLILEEECLVADIKKHASIRMQATKLSKRTGKKFSFRQDKEAGKIKVWRVN